MARVFAELDESQKAIDVHFEYNPELLAATKAVGSGRFVPADKGGPLWRFPLTLQSGRRLRAAFGTDLDLGIGLRAWGLQQRDKERNLGSMARADDYPLEKMKLLERHPALARYLRPYQRADVAMMAATNVLNGNDMGLGKTVEVIAAILEADLLNAGPHLIVAPKTSLDGVWRIELEKWLGTPVITWSGDVKPEDRKHFKEYMADMVKKGKPFFLVTTPTAVRAKGGLPVDVKQWASFTIDEFHKSGLSNASGNAGKGSQFSQAAKKIKSRRRFLLSGTPMGGKPIKLWGALHWLEPQEYRSKWQWVDDWLVANNNGFGVDVGGLRKDKEDQFYAAHARHMVRRLKREVMPQLPPKIYADVWCSMGPAQKKQYDKFAADAEIRIEEERLTAIGILAEYTRLKQFANAVCKLEREFDNKGEEKPLVVLPTPVSAKLGPLVERLEEQGVCKGEDSVAGELALVGSESARMVLMVAAYLKELGLYVEVITGATPVDERTRIQKICRDPNTRPQVIVMTTTAGGMSINLQEANSVHILDETWVPDDQAQLEDRADRGSRKTPLLVFYYRTRGTIQELIWRVVGQKAVTNRDVLDVRRLMYKEAGDA